MNTLRTLTGIGLALALPVVVGCASRAAPFDSLDQAQVTIFRLQGQEAPPVAPAAPAAGPGALIPGVPAELQQMGQQLAQGLQQMLPPGVLPPGLIPGQPATPVAPQPAAVPRFKGYIILGQQPLMDADVKDEMLDVFGSEDSFGSNRGNCFYPEMGVAFVRQDGPPVELLVSLQCNQAQMDGAMWPHKTGNGFTPEASQRMNKLYGRLWGGAPMTGGM
jgi:hypothetical protein